MTGISIIVSWCDREEIRHAIDSMRKTVAALDGELIIVNLNGEAAKLDSMLGDLHDLKVVHCAEGAYFNKCLAQNIGAAAATGSLLFFCDCDILLNVEVLSQLLALVMSDEKSFGTIAGVVETECNSRNARFLTQFGYTLHLKVRTGNTLTIVDHEEDAGDGSRQAPGLLMVRRDDFERVNGYNSNFAGWGWEDQDIIARLTLGAGLTRQQYGLLQHISHDDEARTGRFPPFDGDRWTSRDRIFRQALANYDNGDFEGTYLTDRSKMPNL